MIYLKPELEQFEKVKKDFAVALRSVLGEMWDTFNLKGSVRDSTSPIHHRQSPLQMLSTAQAKCRRIESLLGQLAEERTDKTLEGIEEECVDAANYLCYIAAFCKLLQFEQAK